MKNSTNKMLTANMKANLYEIKERVITGVYKLDPLIAVNNTLLKQDNRI